MFQADQSSIMYVYLIDMWQMKQVNLL
uniref:Uncharacterized protein n=1 Tax=Arundo donax TaxID=35708 RepID=A0A0A8YZR1_ARUDO